MVTKASSPAKRERTVMIIGSGLGGATLALALLRRGFDVGIYEQSPVLPGQGAGLTLPTSSLRVFAGLGLWERLCPIAVGQHGGEYVHYRTGVALTGEPDHDWLTPPTSPDDYAHSHRAAVLMLLADAIRELAPDAFRFGHRLRHFEQDGTGVFAEFENGARAEADLLVGCDGLQSVAHRVMFGERSPRFTGVVAMRTMIPAETVRPYLSRGRFTNYVGPTASFLRYGVNKGSLINCVGLARSDRWREEGWVNKSSRAEFLEVYGDFHPDVVGLIRNAPEDSFFKWALYDREPLPTWTKGRATLLGDAAHPMLPFLGQGATMAFEDGFVLARALERYDDYEEAFRAYEKARIERTTIMMRASRQQGEAMMRPDPLDYATHKVDLAGLRDYDPRTVPV